MPARHLTNTSIRESQARQRIAHAHVMGQTVACVSAVGLHLKEVVRLLGVGIIHQLLTNQVAILHHRRQTGTQVVVFAGRGTHIVGGQRSGDRHLQERTWSVLRDATAVFAPSAPASRKLELGRKQPSSSVTRSLAIAAARRSRQGGGPCFFLLPILEARPRLISRGEWAFPRPAERRPSDRTKTGNTNR